MNRYFWLVLLFIPSILYGGQKEALGGGDVNLKLIYHCEEVAVSTAADVSGNSNDGTISGGLIIGVDGEIGRAFAFGDNTSNTRVYFNALGIFDGDFSFSVWIVPTAVDGFPVAGVAVFKVQLDRNTGMTLDETQFGATNASLVFWERNDANQWNWVEFTSPVANQRLHVVGTKSKTDGKKLYINGALVDTDSNTDSGKIVGAGDNSLGGPRSDVNNETFEGTIDEFMIWNRTLTAAEAANIFERQR